MNAILKKLAVLVRFTILLFFFARFSFAALALSETREVTPAFLRDHPNLFVVDVKRNTDGLIAFTVKHEPQKVAYLVAHLIVYHDGKLVVDTSTPLFGRKTGNIFHFSLLPRDIRASSFSIANCGLAGSGEEAMPIPGCIHYDFRLLDFVPKELLEPAPRK